jgi:hypothetical protein
MDVDSTRSITNVLRDKLAVFADRDNGLLDPREPGGHHICYETDDIIEVQHGAFAVTELGDNRLSDVASFWF